MTSPTSILRTGRAFLFGAGGGIATIFSLAMPVGLGLMGIAVEAARWNGQRAELQAIADAAALSAAQDLQLGTTDEAKIHALVDGLVAAKTGNATEIEVETKAVREKPVTASEDSEGAMSGVTVRLTQDVDMTLGPILGLSMGKVRVTATVMTQGIRICVVALDEAAPDTLRLADKALINASGCSVYVNSSSPTAIRAEKKSVVTSLMTCSAGGYTGSTANFAPEAPVTDCPVIEDPLAHREVPPSSVCDPNAEPLVLLGVTRTLSPGTYCGGLVIDKGASVTLMPGIYVIKNGPLVIGPRGQMKKYGDADDGGDGENNEDDEQDGGPGDKGFLRGTNVGFFFTGTVKPDKDGTVTVMRFMKNSEVEMTAPTDGPMAGLLFHEDRTSEPNRRFEIMSDSARRLVGTIYLPRGIFAVSAKQRVADQSEYTAIVTRRMELSKEPVLVLNTRYDETNVPVPDGLGPNSGVRLTH
jgi:Flp pilus assembly protein TadG